jgi:hypothetical protein
MEKLTPQIIEQVEDLLQSNPTELREHLTEAYFGYTAGINTDVVPPNFKEVSESVSFIIRFLSGVEKSQTEQGKNFLE